ncbi:hypothetical protein AB0L99_37015 [Streptomyces sp. NPDC051954]|jgi:hypothetical protein|uniref:hypothetical protein n=1 Tax=Streptomyces sp. NPDC051954 TaxID=3155524 RepID=UPI00343A7F42
MGVFARLFRRSKATEEASTAEAQAGTPTAEPAADEAEGTEAAETKAPAEAAEEAVETVEATAGEGVEIPKQHSAEDSADRDADEGART